MTELFLLGVSHHTAPLALRERLAFTADEQRVLLERLRSISPEVVALLTCNRSELYGLGSPEPACTALARQAGLTVSQLAPYLQTLRGEAVAEHLFRVAAGLDSLVLGEAQILGQVRQAEAAARRAGAVGPILGRLFNRAVVTGKRARRETAISQGAGSVSHAAVALAKESLGSLAGRRGLVIGVGEMGLLVARTLAAHGLRELLLCNRTEERAAALAREVGARVVPWAQLDGTLVEVDIAVVATAADAPLLTRELLAPALAERASPLLLIDIAVPRNVDPTAVDLPNLLLHDLDALAARRAEGLRGREAVVPAVEAIVAEEVAAFRDWLTAREVVPVIRALTSRAEQIRVAEVEKALRRLGHLDARDREVVQALSHAIINTLLHAPVSRLRAGADPNDASALVALFALDDPGASGEPVRAFAAAPAGGNADPAR